MKNINLIQARKAKGLTQEQLAIILGFKGKQTVANWENGHSTPTLKTALQASEVLGKDVTFLFPSEVQESCVKSSA